jgi:hypothetical protein
MYMPYFGAALNGIVVFSAVYNRLLERNVEGFKPAGHQIVMSAAKLLMALWRRVWAVG